MLDKPLAEYIRITDRQKKALSRLGINTVRDLLYHLPTRYSNMAEITTIQDANNGDLVTLYGTIDQLKTKKSFKRKVPMSTGRLTDIRGDHATITWMHQAYIAKMLHNCQTVKITGALKKEDGKTSLMNPEFEPTETLPIDTHDSLFTDGGHDFGFPVYRETRGITSKWIYHSVRKLLSHRDFATIADNLPDYLRERYHLPELKTALIWVHLPEKARDAEAARKRFAFEEIFFIQLHRQQIRRGFEELYTHSYQIDRVDVGKFIERYPFTLTDSQADAIDTILADITSPKPMSRLLEGDVGSGKTAVAAAVAYGIISNTPGRQSYGHMQVAYMAPTEVLATQLFESFIEYFDGLGIQIGLLTGSTCRKYPTKVASNQEPWTTVSKSQLKKWIANGEVPIVIGTHALISKSIDFKHLGLVIVDEQHRFGTKQRLELAKKAGSSPHFLSMTATPIPRTLALTIYGDLDLTVIDQMPAGRKPVVTTIVTPTKRDDTYDHIRTELATGRQAYVICPRIFEPDPEKENALQMKSVVAEAERLRTKVFPDYRIGEMHSKMKKQEKLDVMQAFANHDIDILVSTSVVEVGVNVPNATNIIIEGAERFGLAQLHQLRGRVMRSSYQPYCFLFTDSSNEKSHERLRALATAKNGFELAEHDLMQRGAGDLAGQKQWGISDLGMEAIKNIKMVEAARDSAREIIHNDPHLENFPELVQILANNTWERHLE